LSLGLLKILLFQILRDSRTSETIPRRFFYFNAHCGVSCTVRVVIIVVIIVSTSCTVEFPIHILYQTA